MPRLGLWGEGTAFKSKLDFVKELKNRGVGEHVAVSVVLQGWVISSLQGLVVSRSTGSFSYAALAALLLVPSSPRSARPHWLQHVSCIIT